MNFKEIKIKEILKEFKDGDKNRSLNSLLKLIKDNPDELGLSLLYGKMCLEVNKLDEAEKIFLFLLKKNEKSLDYLKNIYLIYLKKNNIGEAKVFIKKILNIDPKNYIALRDYAYLEYLDQNYREADNTFKNISSGSKRDVFALNIHALVKLNIEEIYESKKLLENAINLDPKYIDSYNNLGKILFDLEDIDGAYLKFKEAYKINKNNYNTLVNIGNILSLKDKNYYSITAYKKALAIKNNETEIFSNICIAYSRVKDFNNALKYYDKVKKTNITNPSLNLSMSYLYLYKNEFSKAWALFDSRIQNRKFFKKNFDKKTINNILNNKKEFNKNDKVLILREQGVGEEILFSSIYPDLIKFTNNVTIESDPRLIKIFERSFKKNIFVKSGKYSTDSSQLKKFDVIIFAGSLCEKFRKNINDFPRKNYLISDLNKDQVFNKLPIFDKNKLKIGISWKSKVSVYGNLKSLNLADFRKLFSKERQFFNLQYGNVNKEIKNFNKEKPLINCFDKVDLFNDFESCISLLKNLDIFVTISNSTAHIAGALGIKTILICPKKSSTYFYWSNEKQLNPWYNNINILRVTRSIKDTINQVDEILKSYE